MHFNGLKTPFEDFLSLAKFLDDVDHKLPGREHASLRELLKIAEKGVLDLLPSVAKTGSMTIEGLQKYIDMENEKFHTHKEEYEGIISKTSILKTKSQINFSSLEELIESCEKHIREVAAGCLLYTSPSPRDS